ncbi:glycoside hydrolase family 130 protein [Haloferula sargassicola]
MPRLLPPLALCLALPLTAADLPDWALGPFSRPENAGPVIEPEPASTFRDPILGEPVHWEKLHTFNPAAVLKDGKIHVLYRAEDDSGEMAIGRHTSRLGLAVSDDGLDFQRRPAPVFFPAEDDQKPYEWPGGCEDPRLATAPDGSFLITYTQWNRKDFRIGIAKSDDLVTWTKLGSPFAGTRYENLRTKSAAIVHELVDGTLVAAKIDGRYWMYFGERQVNLASSTDLLHWQPVEAGNGKLKTLIRPRKGKFDSSLTEVGPQAVKTDNGIVLIYNARNANGADRDPAHPAGVYGCGQVLFSADDPAKVLDQLDEPFFKPELDWEKTGQYASGTTFAEGLLHHDGRWFLYYGCADSFVGVAMTPAP